MFWIQGYVEITTLEENERDEHAWQSVMAIGPLVDGADIVSERLFGLSKRCVVGEAGIDSLASGRGLPQYPSEWVSHKIAQIREHQKEYGKGEVGGYTFAYWNEIKTVEFTSEELRESDWALVLDLVSRLEQDYRFSDDKIRIVVWFDW